MVTEPPTSEPGPTEPPIELSTEPEDEPTPPLTSRAWTVAVYLLLAVAVGAAVMAVLVIVQAWRMSADEAVLMGEGEPASRLDTFSMLLPYARLGLGSPLYVIGFVAVLAIAGLTLTPWARDRSLTWRRRVSAVAVAATIISLLVMTLVASMSLVGMSFGGEEFQGWAFAQGWLLTLGPILEVLLWAALLLLLIGGWPRARDDDDIDDEDELDPDEIESLLRELPRETARVGPEPPVERPRLRADGSSDSGYDEFRFRR